MNLPSSKEQSWAMWQEGLTDCEGMPLPVEDEQEVDIGPQRAKPASVSQINAQTKQVKRELTKGEAGV